MPNANTKTGRLLAIGDVHGCIMQLDALWIAIAPTQDDTVVFLGDYVDRGPDSKGVIDRLLEWKQTHKLVCLRGNHELMMVRSKDDLESRKMWMQFGGAETLASYSPRSGRMGGFDDVPESHWDFLENQLLDYYETSSTIFTHANLVPDQPLNEQAELWLFWESLTGPVAHESGKVFICGHTSQRSGKVLDLGTTICIDTYVYGGGTLTCLDVNARHIWQADILGRVVESDLPERD